MSVNEGLVWVKTHNSKITMLSLLPAIKEVNRMLRMFLLWINSCHDDVNHVAKIFSDN